MAVTPDTPLDIPPIDVGALRRLAVVAAGLGGLAFAALAAVNFTTNPEAAGRDLALTYLVGFVFWSSLPFGSLGLSCLGFLTTASWNVVLRRCLQASMRTTPVLFALFLPLAASVFIAGGKYAPYWWADATYETVPAAAKDDVEVKEQAEKYKKAGWGEKGPHDHGDSLADVAAYKHERPEAIEEARHKMHDYLNPGFFVARTVGYFAILGTFMFFIGKWAKRFEESNDPKAWSNLRGIAGPGLLSWALLMTLAVTDWVMSIEPTWASSMFPVVFGMNQFMTVFAFSISVFYTLNMNHQGVMGIVKDKFRIDMGTLTFGFTMLWAYATFCQYMLIWAGNLPEEISYYRKRGDHGWEILAYALMAFHWLLPFVVMTFREVKTNPRAMRFMCLLLLTIGIADVTWWLVPALPHGHGWAHVPMAVAAVIGVGGLWGLAFTRELAKKPILPDNSEGRFLANWGHH